VYIYIYIYIYIYTSAENIVELVEIKVSSLSFRH